MKTPEEFLAANGLVPAADIDRQGLTNAFLAEMEKGLRGEESSLRMIPAYVGVDGKVEPGAKADTVLVHKKQADPQNPKYENGGSTIIPDFLLSRSHSPP